MIATFMIATSYSLNLKRVSKVSCSYLLLQVDFIIVIWLLHFLNCAQINSTKNSGYWCHFPSWQIVATAMIPSSLSQ